MNWVEVVFHLGEMRGRHQLEADGRHDPDEQMEHRNRAVMADVLQEALVAGLSDEELAELAKLNEPEKSK